jgi:VacB/RNase II family 3'-5' exoribonuclease
VLQNLGPDSAADFPSRYAAVNYQLEANESSEPELHAAIDLAMQQRPERTDLPLASIDPAAARDIDDALCARVLDQGWEVIVAIADPASVLALDTDTGQAAQRRAATAYLPHRQLPMLPPHIAENTCSLLGNQLRLAMLCTLQIAATGEVIDASFAQATIRSRAQLSYAELERCFEQQSFDAIDPATRDSLQALRQVSERMRHWRGATQLLIDDKPEYRMCLNAAGRIEGFSVSTKGVAQRIVEECMVATNQAAARKLSDHGGLFSSHAGFRTDKLADADSLLRAAGWDKLNDAQELTQLQHYRAALAYLGGQPQYHHQRNILSRFLQRATVSSSAKPHFGMGVASYLTFTSPLRRYVDFFNHQQMQRLLQGEPPLAMEAIQLQQLEARLARIRQAIHWSEQWLKCEYLERHRGTPEQGHVVQANPFGLVVRLDDSGIEGILEKRHLPAGMKFNAAKLRFGKDGSTIGLDDAVTVGVSSIKRDKRQILFKLLNA